MSDLTNKKIGAIASVIFAIWAGSFLLLSLFLTSPSDRGLFGDSFGAVNALFSGFALAGVIVAILLQGQELTLQRRELELTREELARSAQAQTEIGKWNQATGILQFTSSYVDLLKKTAADFRVVHSGRPSSFGSWPSGNITNKNTITQDYRIILDTLTHLDAAADGLEYVAQYTEDEALRRTCTRLIKSHLDRWVLDAFLEVAPLEKWRAWLSRHFPLLPTGFRFGSIEAEVSEISARYDRYKRLLDS